MTARALLTSVTIFTVGRVDETLFACGGRTGTGIKPKERKRFEIREDFFNFSRNCFLLLIKKNSDDDFFGTYQHTYIRRQPL